MDTAELRRRRLGGVDIWANVARRTRRSCWLWTGSMARDGYGVIKIGGSNVRAHRAVWERTRGPIPDDLCVCHTCDIRACVNPTHLFLGTVGDNNTDRHTKGRDACGMSNGMNTKPSTRPRGEKHGRSILTEGMVRAIRASGKSARWLARTLGIGATTVNNIRNGVTWRHVS